MRWATLYSAWKRRLDSLIGLPTLPNTFLGWIPALYRITDEQVLASTGLDAFVFLLFFKMSACLFSIMFFFALTVLLPINSTMFPSGDGVAKSKLQVQTHSLWDESSVDNNRTVTQCTDLTHNDHPCVGGAKLQIFTGSYLAFTYFFTFLTLYMVDRHTRCILHIRQDHLGTQSTITDRTFHITGIPRDAKFINPSLISKLLDPWIYDEPPSGEGSTTQSSGASSPSGGLAVLAPTPNLYSDNDSFRPPALGSSLAFDGQNQGPSPLDSNISLGDTHIW
ncbi:Calcium permeable stress-gated cation channel 1 [Ceratocystis lukuohia]|uniref:Calcium permeable stress-gated cation channel 1 n=1 Tax=Ceratocystis lukuohia TaxID=2019550 RepID=A0ABR4MFY1_9PEZI